MRVWGGGRLSSVGGGEARALANFLLGSCCMGSLSLGSP